MEKEKMPAKYEPEKGVVKYQSPGMIISEVGGDYIARITVSPELRKNLNFKVRKNSLEFEISKKVERQEEDKSAGSFLYEKAEGEFRTMVGLDKDIDTEKVKSEYKDSILTITMPKKKS